MAAEALKEATERFAHDVLDLIKQQMLEQVRSTFPDALDRYKAKLKTEAKPRSKTHPPSRSKKKQPQLKAKPGSWEVRIFEKIPMGRDNAIDIQTLAKKCGTERMNIKKPIFRLVKSGHVKRERLGPSKVLYWL